MKRRDKESGFAMLLVFLMAACIAITLYFEVPRVAFQAERQRELLLVDRGNQFKRAIQVFVTDQTNNPRIAIRHLSTSWRVLTTIAICAIGTWIP